MFDNKQGDSASFDTNWKNREESLYTHWTRGEVENQIQLAFRNHWTLFSELMEKEPNYNGGKRALEIGCGRGSLSCYFTDAGFDCTLVDLSASVIDVAKNIFEKNNLKANFQVGDANALEIPDNTFDVIYSIGLLEHFEDIEKPLKEQIRVLDKGGIWFGYIVPKYTDNVQKDYEWINDILKGYHKQTEQITVHKESVYRSDFGSGRYVPILEKLGLKNIQVSGVYPLPMISHSIDFPFSLMPKDSEKALVKHFEKMMDENRAKTGKHPWLCEEGFGNAFLVWGVK
uniref:class I SAM-dependent methyltransferase n=1 Tax=Aliarcobacter sp. TaxID=2321116 RepID=UPI004048441F